MPLFEDDPEGVAGRVLATEKRQEVVNWILAELDQIERDRAGREEKWRKHRRQREGRPEEEQKNYPWKKSANVSVPLAAQIGQTMYGAMKNTFSAKRPFWTAEAINASSKDDLDTADIITKYFDVCAESSRDLNKRAVDKVVLYETGTLGSCPIKVPWTTREWHFVERNPTTGVTEQVRATLHDGPEVIPIPLEDFFIRETFPDIQMATLVSHRVWLPWHELKNREASGIYENVDDIKGDAQSSDKVATEESKERQGVMASNEDRWEIHEVNFYWDVNGDGIFEDCIMTIERLSGKVLREGYNQLGMRPYEMGNFLHVPGSVYGLGTGWFCEHMQDEADMLHNTRLDSTHLMTLPMFAARKGSGIKSKETMFPGKLWMLDSPREDLLPLQMPVVNIQASVLAENMAVQYAQKASGMTDTLGGFADQTMKSRDSIGLMGMRMRQGTTIFGSIQEGLEDSYGRIGLLIFYQWVRNKDRVIENERKMQRFSPTEIASLEKALSIPMKDVPVKLRFSVRTSDVEQTFEVRRQNLMTLVQLYSMYQQRAFPIVQQLYSPQAAQMPPQVTEFLNKMLVGQTKIMDMTFKFFGEEDTQRYVIDWKKVEALEEMKAQLMGAVGGSDGIGSGQVGGGVGAGGAPTPPTAASGGLGNSAEPQAAQGMAPAGGPMAGSAGGIGVRLGVQ